MRQIRISDQVADYIVGLIAEGKLVAGDALPSEGELSRRLDVSRPAVREATNALAGRGVIAVSSGRGPTVLGLAKGSFAHLVGHGLAIGQVSLLQVLDVRRGLEEVAAELAALHRTDTQAAELRELAGALEAGIGDVERFWPADVAFHRALAQATHNVLLASMLMGISDAASQSARTGVGLARNREEWDLIVRVHLETAAGIIEGDPARARRGMAAHFDSAIARLKRGPQRRSTGDQA